MALVIMRLPLRQTRPQRKNRLRPIQACIWLFSSTLNTMALSGEFM